ncbi:hypothetical protein [Acinetobacter sp. A47]|uniref:hypothetical protein n=1 Tax=Acinetobacter sp. A47 TaxID=1561217 RepID=UPI00056ECFE6|nr:hypothetical protein [Acinetobacter sp. A47]
MFGPDQTFEYSEDLRAVFRSLTRDTPLVIYCLVEHAAEIMNIAQMHSEFKWQCMQAGKPQVRSIVARRSHPTTVGRVDTYPIIKDLHHKVIPFTMVNSSQRTREHFHIARFVNGHSYRHKSLDYDSAQFQPEQVKEMVRYSVATPDHAIQVLNLIDDKLRDYIDPPLDADQLAAYRRESMARVVRPSLATDVINKSIWGNPRDLLDMFK